MECSAFALLLLTLPIIVNMEVILENRKRMEKIRRLCEHDGIDTGTVHISYPHSPSSPRRLTKREALANLVGQPRRHANITVRVTMSASGHALDLHLAPSQLHMHGALVTVMDGDDVEEQFHLRDDGCHFQGSLAGAGGDGMVSVHFCDGELVGGANDGHTEYQFHSHSLHSHRRRRSSSRETVDEGNGKNVHSGESMAKKVLGEHKYKNVNLENKMKNVNGESKMKNVSGETNAVKTARGAKDPEGNGDDFAGSTTGNEELYHTIVSWKKMDFEKDNGPLTNDYIVIKKNKKKKNKNNVRKKRNVPTIKKLKNRPNKEKKQKKDRLRRQAEDEENNEDEDEEIPLEVPHESHSKGLNPDYDPKKVPEAEFGIIVDEHFLNTFRFLYPTKDAVLRLIIVRYTAVQGLYGNPEVTGFNLKIQIKLVYLWKKNPSFYKGNQLPLGPRMVNAGLDFTRENADFKTTDVAALWSYGNTGWAGMAYVGGVCHQKQKTYVTVRSGFYWGTEAHEFGHTLGMPHVPDTCNGTWDKGFMIGTGLIFATCYTKFVTNRLKTRKIMGCMYRKDVHTTNITGIKLQPLYPVVALGLNYMCRTYFRNDSVFIALMECSALCAVTGENERAFSMSLVSEELYGLPCNSTGDEICLRKNRCVKREGETTIPMGDSWRNSGTWGEWSSYAKDCSSACGVGVRISSRECSVPDRTEACVGYRYRALLCNTQPCPGDDLMMERELRVDRANYMCSLLKARNAPHSAYLKPRAVSLQWWQIDHPFFRCLVQCEQIPKPKESPPLQRKDFGLILQNDGTPCGKVNFFMRQVKGVTARCLRGQCRKFGCNGQVLEDGGKVMDNCGVCGGDGSSCKSQTKKILVGDKEELVKLLPAGTKDVLIALQPDSHEGEVAGHLKLSLQNMDDQWIIHPTQRDCSIIETNEKNPLKFAGTYWTVFDQVVLRAPGPLDQPMKVRVRNNKKSPAQNVTVLLRLTFPATFTKPPKTCENGGQGNATTKGCDCATGFYGKRCETDCKSPCYNGGIVLGKICDCQCSCKDNPGIDHTARCKCLEGFTGPDCTQCTIKCFNGGILNNQTCECKCPPGCSKLDCSGCKYNKKMPWYKGQYGRGALEVSADLKPVMLNQASSLLCRPAGRLWHHQLLVAVGVVLWWGCGASLIMWEFLL